MARTKADAYTKAAVKAPRKAAVLSGGHASSSSPSGAKANKYSGGNSYCTRPTPSWQKPITSFFSKDGPSQKPVEDENAEKMEVNVDEIAEGSACSSGFANGCASSSGIAEGGADRDEIPGTSSDEIAESSVNNSIVMEDEEEAKEDEEAKKGDEEEAKGDEEDKTKDEEDNVDVV